MSANATTGRKKIAHGKDTAPAADTALGHESQNTSSPEGAKEGGDLPTGWRWVTLREIADIAGGVTKGQKRRPNESVRRVAYLRVANVQRGYLDLNEVKEIEVTENEIETLRLRRGDILFNEGGDRDKLGRGWIWNGELSECLHQNHVFRARLRDASSSPKFISYYGNSVGKKYFYDHGKHTTNLASINLTKLGGLPIPFPPLPEQRRIVAEIEKQFTRLEAGVAALRRVQANLKRYRASVLKAACEGRLVPTEAELRKAELRSEKDETKGAKSAALTSSFLIPTSSFESGEALLRRILAERQKNWTGRGKYKEPAAPDNANLPAPPEGWTWCMSDVFFSFITSGSRGWAKYYSETGPIFLRIGNLDHENIRLDLSDLQHVAPPNGAEGVRTVVQPKDILISITADVGMVGLVPDGLGEAYINQHVALARPLRSISPSYIAYYLCASEGGWGHLKKLQRGATKVGLGLDDIRAVPVPLPPLVEQTRIVAEVERRLSVVEELEAVVSANLKRAMRLRQSILQKAFTGELV